VLALSSLKSNIVHVSECGRHLVVLFSDNQVMLVEDFQRVLNGETVRDIATTIELGTLQNEYSIYLAYSNGRVGIATVSLTPH
jgi:hypothetical protein